MSTAEIRFISKSHPITGVTNSKLGIWCFLASEVMLFGGLFSAYVLLRVVGAHRDSIRFCGRKSFFEPGTLYSYGPR